MPDYMLTVIAAGPRDIQVNNAADILEAIAVCEQITRARVDHGRGGIGSKFTPNTIIDAVTGEVTEIHDRPALVSMEFAAPRARISVRRGE